MKIRSSFVRLPLWALTTIFILTLLRAIIPLVGKWAINQELEGKLGIYTGHIEDFDLSLYRGAYQLQGVTIKKRVSDLMPLLTVKNITADRYNLVKLILQKPFQC